MFKVTRYGKCSQESPTTANFRWKNSSECEISLSNSIDKNVISYFMILYIKYGYTI